MQQKTCDPCVHLFVYNTNTWTQWGQRSTVTAAPLFFNTAFWISDVVFVTAWCLVRGW